MSASFNTIELLTPDEVANILKIAKVTVDRLRKTRKISFHKVGAQIRFDKNDILSYLKNHRIEVVGKQNYDSQKAQ